ncbi:MULTISPECIES: glycosyltransferase family 87 protein [unclassified Bradyrhizobium]|uniref:glycosyltransferase family 87 protein n=1 Tax=unclassified Bradyrhizobium TaxID=2631580 RepID=UPI002915E9CD|nr:MULTISPECIES: glycosyltransferase family 87 protein [unclassified Bradyrhizobium]
MSIARNPLATRLVIAGSAAAGAVYAYLAGEDINWDWQNYHDYAGFALLHGRFDIDVAPGGFQSFLNPLIYLLPYAVRHGLDAPWWGVALGALHGLNLALVYWVARVLLRRAADAFTLSAALIIAALSPMALSEVGTSFADILTTIPILAGIALIFGEDDERGRRFVAAGLLIGAATGLKLTNATFLVGAGVSLLLVARPWRAIVAFGAGSSAGVIVTAGPWALKMARDYGSPLFPFYNTIFRSPEAPQASIVDTRFMPQGLLDALAYPFYWVIGKHPSSEWPFRDPRFAVVIVLLIALIVTGLWQRREVLPLRDRRLLIFFWLSYVLWVLAFSIQRYLMPLELLSAPLIVLLLIRLVDAWRADAGPVASPSRRMTQAVTVMAALGIALASQPTDWMRRPWSDPYRPQLAADLQRPATFLLLQKPLGYVTSFLPQGSRVYQLSELVVPIVPGGVLDRRVRNGLANPLPGGVWALYFSKSPADNPPRLEVLADYDLQIDASRGCERIPGAAGIAIEACPVIARAKPPSTAGLGAIDRTQ